ncbi:hypothetical protein [Vagococcus salmoninarum]|uniref:Uncharacterized protein n=1 Tax=Vagococcus salmoninarum TaxID=2739 RepID=A0A429ZLI2_9ENTE|nr:hypothetical protein [Vagococcus salmoninarum]MBE9390359.1 hypothetical protein [Vagococcus salmoninarum]RST94516.1 hypothetical protein CBF35_09695 [Vagococcus salmoninarum]
MSENPYTAKIDQLVAGLLNEIVIEHAEFMLFREAWLVHSQRKSIIGEATLGGGVTYRFLKES